jgi:hypothetical protein
MSKRPICWGVAALGVLLVATGGVQADTFRQIVADDGHVCNDTQYGPTQAYNTTALHVRSIASRRRVGYMKFDISALKTPGKMLSNVCLDLCSDGAGRVAIYGVIEAQENITVPFTQLTWSMAPGVPNNPLPAVDSPVTLDMADLVGPLATVAIPAVNSRVTTDPNQAMDDFFNSDTNGSVLLLLAPAAEGQNALIWSIRKNTTVCTYLVGETVAAVSGGASNPVPADKISDVYVGTLLNWTPGTYAATHNVYFGTSFADVDAASAAKPGNVMFRLGQETNTYDPPGVLELGKTYYWRVDEVNAPPSSTVIRGAVWSFTAEVPLYQATAITATASSAATNSEPQKTVNGAGLTNGLHSTDSTTMWLSDLKGPQPTWIQYAFDGVYKLQEMRVWNYNMFLESSLGYGVKDVTVEYSTDGANWQVCRETQFAQGPSTDGYAANTTVDLGGVVAQYVRLIARSNWGGTQGPYGLSEVQFFYVPVSPRQPNPAAGAADVAVDALLSWRPGREAVSHKVYFGTDPQAVTNGTAPVQTLTGYIFDPGPLTFGTTYYWKIVEVNEAATPPVWEGPVWSFATAEFSPLDDFESYNDTDNAIFDTWLDDYDPQGDQSGAIVGNEAPPFAEPTVVHSGKQSMPLYYNNAGPTHLFSQTERSWDDPQDWTANGIDTLSLWFCGRPVGFLESASGQITMSGIGTDIFGTADEFRFAAKQLTGDGTIIAKVDSLGNTEDWAKAGVMIRDSFDPGSRFAAVYATISNGVRFQARLAPLASATSDTSGTPAPSDEQKALKTPVWIKIERVGGTINGYYSTDGTKWTPMSWNPQTIAMNNTAYIGLAVTSHTATAATTAQFSGLAATGGVSGSWDVQSIGVAQPANDAAPLYVTLQDNAGKSKTVTYPDPAATNLTTWQPWSIPLSDFSNAGVKLNSVKRLFLGVGDRSNPKPGGAGEVFFDDIAIGHPAPVTP